VSTELQPAREMSPVEAVCRAIKKPDFRERLVEVLPPGIDADRFTRVVLTAIQQNPQIASGDRQSLYNAAIRAAADGLLPDGREGAFVTLAGKIQWMPMVGGIIKRLAGAGITIDAQIVHENDEFEHTLGDDSAIRHKAPKLGTPRGEPLGAYAIARLPNGMVMREVMDRDQIEQVRRASRSGNSGPWQQWWTEMARKTVTRRLSKRLPILDASIAEAIQRDDDLMDFAAGNAGEADTPPPAVTPAGPRRPSSLAAVAATVQQPFERDNDPPFDPTTQTESENPREDF
jgi:recombination protein RecT